MKYPQIYFPNLYALRFFAASLVMIFHIEQSKYQIGLSNCWHNPAIYNLGKLGVIFFFVLSGFLITYLLLVEQKRTGHIALFSFYKRRTLRIWPLYFLILFLALFVLPHIPLFSLGENIQTTIHQYWYLKILLFLLMLPNLLLAFFGIIPFAAQTWSIGTEEQFYLMWPILIEKTKRKFRLMFGIISIYLFIKCIMFLPVFNGLSYISNVRELWEFFCIDCMAIGGIAALILFYKKQTILDFIFNDNLQLLIVLSLLAMIIKGVRIPYLHFEFYALLFSIVILNLAANPNVSQLLENKYLKHLGKISYGIYMYHTIVIVGVINLSRYFGVVFNPTIYFFSFLLTIIISHFSYQYFELAFLRRKTSTRPQQTKYAKLNQEQYLKKSVTKFQKFSNANELK